MSSIYDELRDVTADVMAEFKQGTVKYVEITTPDGAAPDETGEPQENRTTVNATVRPVSTKYVDGSHIVQSDRQVTFEGGVIEPNMNGFFEIDGVAFKIIEILPRPAAGTPVAYTVIVRV